MENNKATRILLLSFVILIALIIALFPQYYYAFDACANFSGGPSPCTAEYLERRALANGYDFCGGDELDGKVTGGITCWDFPPKFTGRCEKMEPVKTLFDSDCFPGYYQSED